MFLQEGFEDLLLGSQENLGISMSKKQVARLEETWVPRAEATGVIRQREWWIFWLTYNVQGEKT